MMKGADDSEVETVKGGGLFESTYLRRDRVLDEKTKRCGVRLDRLSDVGV